VLLLVDEALRPRYYIAFFQSHGIGYDNAALVS
jgi:hypothetical protein